MPGYVTLGRGPRVLSGPCLNSSMSCNLEKTSVPSQGLRFSSAVHEVALEQADLPRTSEALQGCHIGERSAAAI